MNHKQLKISVIGTGYVGLVTSVCFAFKGFYVEALDINPDIVEKINKSIPTIYEENLDVMLKEVVNSGRLKATLINEDSIKNSDVVFICVGSPSNDGIIDLSQIVNAATFIGKALTTSTKFTSIVVKSTVLPTTTDTLVRSIIEKESGKKIGDKIGIGMNPEFLREGSAISDFMNPDRIVFGYEEVGTLNILEKLYSFWDCEKLKVNTRTAEMIKYTNNTFLALQISAINELSNISTRVGNIDFNMVVEGVSLDKRWNPKKDGARVNPGILSYLKPGYGFGGSCFPKDVQAMRSFGIENGCEVDILQAILDVNQNQPYRKIESFLKLASNSNSIQSVLVLGLAFKENTDDIRESPSLKVIQYLNMQGIKVFGHDPVSAFNAKKYFSNNEFTEVTNWQENLTKVDAVILVTKWNDYLTLPNYKEELKGKYILDSRCVFDKTNFPDSVYVN